MPGSSSHGFVRGLRGRNHFSASARAIVGVTTGGKEAMKASSDSAVM